MATADTDDPYAALRDHVERITYLRDATGLLNWDQQVTMPEGGSPARAKQLSTLSGTTHDLLTEDRVGELLDACEAADLTDEQRAVCREIRREHERATSVPSDLVSRHAEASSEAQQVWQDAKADADFEAFAPTLDRLRELRVERAEHIDPRADTYPTLYEDNMPTLPLETVERVFDTLREELPPLVAALRESGTELARPFEGQTFPEAEQAALNEAVADFLGYDWDRGRLDASPHPFTSGTQFDARITTRYKPEDPLDALTATIHEFGHATYQLGLPRDEYGVPLGSARFEVHESQSRFWENHVGRTRAFWEAFLPTFQEHLSGVEDLTVETAYEAANRIYPENRIRVEADELTYHMHILLRHDVEREYLDGDLSVDEVPARWNELMDEYLGVTPDDDAEGCLQDIHWTTRFGGFPSYTVGSVLAAQLTAAMREDLDVEGCISDREFDRLREWMTDNVHRHGQRYEADELVAVATGERLTADYFLEYAREKFGDLYDL
ncbi:carboxypeptidase M32 [Salinirubellus salinus]|uniref:Metal-dependent carboxypeptidase n=1 Tax=Salinirubellus salinus TaxID=1364945 RepID=A0A9E7U9T6_9EURY|nr:carboxypeptidase M32 [Salinirubellus salinus]UWM53179.1 carboxypeptidase M32 [Salinirubellus salinus]